MCDKISKILIKLGDNIVSGKRLTDVQKNARKIDKVVKSYAIQCSERFKYENFRAPDQEEKVWIYTDACKLAMTELTEDAQLVLIDYYFVRGNRPFNEGVTVLIQSSLGKVPLSINCPKRTKDGVFFIKIGNAYYHQSIEDLKEKILKMVRQQVATYMDELLVNVKNKKGRLSNISKQYSSMHIFSEMERKSTYSKNGEDVVIDETLQNYVSYKDVEDLTRSLIRDAVMFELIRQNALQGESVGSTFQEQ